MKNTTITLRAPYEFENRLTFDLPHDMQVAMNNALHTYTNRGGDFDLSNKATGFGLLSTALYYVANSREFDDFMSVLNEEEGSLPAWLGFMEGIEGDLHMVVCLHRPSGFRIEAYDFMVYDVPESGDFEIFTEEEN